MDAVVHKNIGYFRRYRTRIIDRYDSVDQLWSTLSAQCHLQDASLALLPVHDKDEVNYILHTVGGYQKDQGVVGDLYFLSQRRNDDLTGYVDSWGEVNIPPHDRET